MEYRVIHFRADVKGVRWESVMAVDASTRDPNASAEPLVSVVHDVTVNADSEFAAISQHVTDDMSEKEL